jgi:hypothetical protein
LHKFIKTPIESEQNGERVLARYYEQQGEFKFVQETESIVKRQESDEANARISSS